MKGLYISKRTAWELLALRVHVDWGFLLDRKQVFHGNMREGSTDFPLFLGPIATMLFDRGAFSFDQARKNAL